MIPNSNGSGNDGVDSSGDDTQLQVAKIDPAEADPQNQVVALDSDDTEQAGGSVPPASGPTVQQIRMMESSSFLEKMKYVVVNFWSLGLIAFGGPTAHIALLREMFVTKKKMLDEETFLELFGLCQAMPGPTSTQLVVALATLMAGIPGGLLAYIMWSMPGFIILAVAGVTSGLYFDTSGGTPNWMAGLAPSATAQVFVATYQISKSILGSKLKIALGLMAACVTLIVMGDSRIDVRAGSASFPLVLLLGGFVTMIDSQRRGRMKFYYTPPADATERLAMDAHHKGVRRQLSIPQWLGALLVAVWLVVLIVVIVLRADGTISDNLGILFESMYRIGSIIYGGGQVVLPMMQQEQYCSPDQFFQGFALVQALPGPLFNFSAFLGGVFAGVPGTFVGLMGINLPGLILTFGVLPFWARLRRVPLFKVFITGVGAAAIGLLFTACVQLYEAGIGDAADATVFLVSGALSAFFHVPVPFAILIGSVLGFILSPGAAGIGQALYCAAELSKANGTSSG